VIILFNGCESNNKNSIPQAAFKPYNDGIDLMKNNEYEQAIVSFEKALIILKGLPDTELYQANCHMYIGMILPESKRAELIVRLSEALNIFLTLPNTELKQADCHQIIGSALIEVGRYEDGIEQEKMALALYGKFSGTEENQNVCRKIIRIVQNSLDGKKN
jgi:tetratricopeptide (TPR) repeat protein